MDGPDLMQHNIYKAEGCDDGNKIKLAIRNHIGRVYCKVNDEFAAVPFTLLAPTLPSVTVIRCRASSRSIFLNSFMSDLYFYYTLNLQRG